MAGPRPAASRSSPCSSRPRCSCSPPCSPTATTRAPTTAASAPATAAPARPFAKGRPTANPSTTAAPPRTPRPRHRPPRPRPSTPAAAPPPPPPPPPPPATPGAHLYKLHPAPASAPTGPAPPAPSTPARRPSRRFVSAADQALYLKFHNDIRANHKGDPLSWNDTLSAAAQKVADTTSRAGTGKCGIEKAIVSWTNEVKDYDPKNPVPSHFTQVVGGTTQVGCALTVCAPGTIFDPKFTNTAEYYVCEYAPPGNIIGQFDQMVSV
ncbi:PR-1-like protein [Mycena indigotica]|uniref:PR-1-like protein n=1 Tax=Mycena indigotica TaxID=2126181 RepID=A0A8H6W2N9_9AGAR|nr:PR-1-like protein [Mycena indigotica]KAF7303374.1 PR-1-like protein [Mycena indigotica]